jgi:hypothetical protein
MEMKLIKKDGTVIMKAYGVEELESDVKDDAINNLVYTSNPGEFYQWSRNDVIEHVQANEYLFTKEGEMIPIMKYMNGNEIIKRTLKIAGEEVEVQIEDKGVKRIKQITIDVELEGKTVKGTENCKVDIRYQIENLINKLGYARQVGDLRFVDLTDEYDELHKEGLN